MDTSTRGTNITYYRVLFCSFYHVPGKITQLSGAWLSKYYEDKLLKTRNQKLSEGIAKKSFTSELVCSIPFCSETRWEISEFGEYRKVAP